jgi:hypothetical protein
MKQKDNYGLEKGDVKRGYCEGEYKGDDGIDDTPKNSQWRDIEDGGFLGRSKGQER